MSEAAAAAPAQRRYNDLHEHIAALDDDFSDGGN